MAKKKKRSKHLVKRTAASRKRVVKYRPLHKRVLLHPLMVLFLMCVGVVLVGSTINRSNAANTTISVTVEAPELTDPAVISQPADGAIFSSTPITVTGSCPDNSYVNLYRNSQFSGVDICTDNNFQIQTDLFSGDNQLLAQDYNITNEVGPTGTPINVTYNPPVITVSSPTTVSTSPTSSSTSTPSIASIPLLVNTQFQYQAVTVGQIFSWNINIAGGTPPYNVTVNWGDGTTSTYSFSTDPTFTISHDYKTAGNYVIKVNVKDFAGRKTFLQLVGIIHSPIVGSAVSGTATPTSVSSSVSKAIRHYSWVAWPTYLIIVALVFSFWLGEREEISILARHKRPAHR
jgi:hypothetical protein